MPAYVENSSRRALLAAVGATVLGGCTSVFDDEGSDSSDENDVPSNDGAADLDWELPEGSPLEPAVEPEPLVTDLAVPWDLAFAPTDELYVTEREGRLLRFETEAVLEAGGDPLDATDVADENRWELPGDHAQGVAVHPDYPDPAFVYVYYGSSEDNRVGRFDASAAEPLETLEVLVEGMEGHHTIGGRIAFGPEGDLWITDGTSEEDPAQDPGRLGGTILRLTPDGDPSDENPDLEDADPRLFTSGHRNPQGLAWLPDGTPLCTDHGPTGRDEIQRLRPGANFGWPVAQGGPDDEEYESYDDHEEYEPPLVNTGPELTWAPAGCVFYEGDAISAWRHRLLVATLYGTHLNVVTLLPPDAEQPPLDGESRRHDAAWLDESYTATTHRVLDDDLGRIRHVTQAPNGDVLAVTSNRDGGAGFDEDRFPRDRDDVLVRIRTA
ncbi:glucose sorbosone dehydrogenase [Natronococcus pandeyae]|uniref:Glucose sorbosone dehydrogenase n=1 Tax=Natronococcus pandeyae TaxID=2055836 RepID=A0A8J8TQE3_9EURY|nr:PQQ-dependent sugar dehydrogenase [Natronococcus pandeyae]TYL38796.1 glucose sorbosone dehydrogenase [Natronococcus pandeyae]